MLCRHSKRGHADWVWRLCFSCLAFAWRVPCPRAHLAARWARCARHCHCAPLHCHADWHHSLHCSPHCPHQHCASGSHCGPGTRRHRAPYCPHCLPCAGLCLTLCSVTLGLTPRVKSNQSFVPSGHTLRCGVVLCSARSSLCANKLSALATALFTDARPFKPSISSSTHSSFATV